MHAPFAPPSNNSMQRMAVPATTCEELYGSVVRSLEPMESQCRVYFNKSFQAH